MLNISELLQKFKSLHNPAHDKKAISEIIKERLNLTIPPEQMEFKNNKLYLSVHPALKSVIYTKKTLVLKEIQEKIKNQLITDIV